MLLLTGASGVGKSTVRTVIAPELPPEVECVELLGLTPPPKAMTAAWRQQTAELAVQRAVELQAEGRHLLLAGDPVPAAEIVAAPSAASLEAIAVCLLDASPEVQAQRLTQRGDPPELLHHHQAFAEWMRKQANDPLHMPHVVTENGWEQMRWDRLESVAADWQMRTIDTTDLTKREAADAVRDWCRHVLAGAAPVLRIAGEKA